MDNWISFPKKELMLDIYLGEQNMDDNTLLFWSQVKISPEIWRSTDFIEDDFWVVALHENYLIWYNDIEEGFDISRFKIKGEILEYGASHNELNFAVIELKKRIEFIQNKKPED